MKIETLRKIDKDYRIIYGSGLIKEGTEEETLAICNDYFGKISDETIFNASRIVASEFPNRQPNIIQISKAAVRLHLDTANREYTAENDMSKQYVSVAAELDRIIEESRK